VWVCLANSYLYKVSCIVLHDCTKNIESTRTVFT
jgi:hypothetical protein